LAISSCSCSRNLQEHVVTDTIGIGAARPVGSGTAVSRRDLLSLIGTVAGSAAMYHAMSSLGFASDSSYKGPIALGGDVRGASVLILGAGLAGGPQLFGGIECQAPKHQPTFSEEDRAVAQAMVNRQRAPTPKCNAPGWR
jgi:hypothetical protein